MAFNLENLDLRSTLLLNALFSILVASLYTFVGTRISRRQMSVESQLAGTMFSVWWYGLGAVTLGAAVTSLMGAAGVTDLAAYITLTHVLIIILCVALAGIVYYLLFLFTGRRGILMPIAVFYIFYYIFLVAYITYSEPARVEIHRWGTEIKYANQIEGPILLALILLLLLPVVVGAVGYLSLFFRVRDRSQKYRIALVAGSLTVWFGSSLVASLTGLSRNEWWQLVSRLLGVTTALVILWAYDPPRWVQKYLGVRSYATVGSQA